MNPGSLIAARIVTRDRSMALSPSLWLARIHQALELRERLYPRPFYRLIFGESDGLPGLVVDRYGDLLAVQITTAGMERVRGEILAALEWVEGRNPALAYTAQRLEDDWAAPIDVVGLEFD